MVLRTPRGRSPFVVRGLVGAFTQWRIGTVAALVLSLVPPVLVQRYQTGRGGGAPGRPTEDTAR